MKINRKKFFDGFKDRIDPTLEQGQVNGLEFLLGRFESDVIWSDVRHIAYALATIFHETAFSFQPVEEGYYLGSKAKAFQKKLRYYPYFGRGYVQLTWKTNYDKAGKALGIDLVNQPEKALDKNVAFDCLTLGLFRGWYGAQLTSHINGSKTDYVNARRCVNVLDKAGLIAGYAKSFEKILRASISGEESIPPATEVTALVADPPKTTDEPAVASPETIVQNADQIINTGDASNLPPPENKELSAPTKDGATSTATKMTIGGIVVPGFVVATIETVRQWISEGYISAAEVGSTVLGFIKENQRYVFLLIALLIVLLIVKKIVKQITFWLELISKAVPQFNNITVVPTETEQPSKWWKIWE